MFPPAHMGQRGQSQVKIFTMRLLILPLYLASLGVYATDPEWIAVLDDTRFSRGPFRRHAAMLQDLGATHQHSFELGSFRGYAFSGSEVRVPSVTVSCRVVSLTPAGQDAAERVAQHPEVAYVQPNHDVSAYGMMEEDTNNWNLGAISHRDPQGQHGPRYKYMFDESAGNGTVVYVMDSGIDIASDEFEGRAEWGMTHLQGQLRPEVQVDDFGHGTRRYSPPESLASPRPAATMADTSTPHQTSRASSAVAPTAWPRRHSWWPSRSWTETAMARRPT